MDKIAMLKSLSYNNSIIEDVRKNRRACDIIPEGEIEQYIKDTESAFTVEDAKAGKVEGVEFFNYDGNHYYLILEC